MTAYQLVFVKGASISDANDQAIAAYEAERQKTQQQAPKPVQPTAVPPGNQGNPPKPKQSVKPRKPVKPVNPRNTQPRDLSVGSSAYKNHKDAYNYFVARGVPSDQARYAANVIKAYNAQIRRGADHATAMDMINNQYVTGGRKLNDNYYEQIVDHLNRSYHRSQLEAEDRAYGIPNGADPRTRSQYIASEARNRAAMDNTRLLNPRRYDSSDALRSAYTYVSHGNQGVNPSSGRVAGPRRMNQRQYNAWLKQQRARGFYVNSRGQLVMEPR